jgi:hypothetical protein
MNSAASKALTWCCRWPTIPAASCVSDSVRPGIKDRSQISYEHSDTAEQQTGAVLDGEFFIMYLRH